MRDVYKASGQDILRIFGEYSKDIPRIFWEYTKDIPGIGRGQRTYINSVSRPIGNSVRREPERNKEQETCNLFLVIYFVLDLSVIS